MFDVFLRGFFYLCTMAQEEKPKKRLADQIEEDQRKMQEEFEKLPPEEQKKIREGQTRLFKKWDNQPWY